MFAYSFGKSNATATRDIPSEIEPTDFAHTVTREEELVPRGLCRIERIERCLFPTLIRLYLV